MSPYTGTEMSLLDNISWQTANRNYSLSLHYDLSHLIISRCWLAKIQKTSFWSVFSVFEVLPLCCKKFWRRFFHKGNVNYRYWNEDFVFYVFFRFPGKTLKGKKYKPLFQYFAKVCRLCVLVDVAVWLFYVLFVAKLALITCLTNYWHLSLCTLNLSPNVSPTVGGSISSASSLLAHPHLIIPILISLQCGEQGAFQVVTDNYVKEEEGTGVVHQAPYFGAVSEMFFFFFFYFLCPCCIQNLLPVCFSIVLVTTHQFSHLTS